MGPPDSTNPSRASRQGQALVVCCADLLFLMALAVADGLIRPHVGAGTVLPAAIYALCFWLVAGTSYVLLTAVFLRRYRVIWPCSPPPEEREALRVASWLIAFDHVKPGLFTLGIIVLPYAVLASSVWLAVTGMAVLAFAAWHVVPSNDPFLAGWKREADAHAEPPPEHARAVAALRDFATQHGLPECGILVVPGRGEAGAEYLPTRHAPTILLSEELVASLSPAERKAVFSHEVGHHRLKHSAKAVLADLGFYALCVLVTGIILEIARPAAQATARQIVGAAPSALLVWYLLMVLVRPTWHAFVRRQERQAHRQGLEMARDPASLISAVRKLAELNEAGEPPSRLQTLLLVDSLSADEIVRLAERWAAENGIDLNPPPEEDQPDEEDPDDRPPEVGFLAIMPNHEDA